MKTSFGHPRGDHQQLTSVQLKAILLVSMCSLILLRSRSIVIQTSVLRSEFVCRVRSVSWASAGTAIHGLFLDGVTVSMKLKPSTVAVEEEPGGVRYQRRLEVSSKTVWFGARKKHGQLNAAVNLCEHCWKSCADSILQCSNVLCYVHRKRSWK